MSSLYYLLSISFNTQSSYLYDTLFVSMYVISSVTLTIITRYVNFLPYQYLPDYLYFVFVSEFRYLNRDSMAPFLVKYVVVPEFYLHTDYTNF